MKKVIAVFLMLSMILAFTGCGENSNVITTDMSKPVLLKWIMPGPGIQTDSQKVFEKFNEELKKVKGFENVSVEIDVIPSADYSQKSFLMQTAGEQIDIMQTYTLDYAKQYRDGLIIDMTDYLALDKDIQKELPEWVIRMGTVEGAQAIIPNYQKMTAAPYGIIIPASHKKYVDDWDAFVETVHNTENEDLYYEAIDRYLKNVYDAGEIDKGLSITSIANSKNEETLVAPFKYDWDAKKVYHQNLSLDGQIPITYKWNRKFFEAGYIRKDILSAKMKDDHGVKDGAVLWAGQCWPGYEENIDSLFDIDVEAFRKTETFYIPYKPAAGGMAISANSKYPDVAMKLIGLMNTDKGKDLYNLLVYGFEGEHYTTEKILENGDKYINPKDYASQGNSSSKYGLWNWVVGNAENAYVTSNERETYKKEIFEEMNENAELSPLIGFCADTTSIDIKLSQIKSIKSDSGLSQGVFEDYEKVYETYVQDLKYAGLEEIQAELQSQVDKFLASK